MSLPIRETTAADDIQKAWKIAESIGGCFLNTGDSQYPMAALVRKEEEAIYFLTDAGSENITEIGDGKPVQLTFNGKSSNEFLFIEGDATVSDDRDKIADLWTTAAKAYWDSANDPAIRLVTFYPTRAELCDGPNKIVAVSKMLFAAAMGGRPNMGENRKTSM